MYSWFIAVLAWLRAQYIALPHARGVLEHHGAHNDKTIRLLHVTNILALNSTLVFELRAEWKRSSNLIAATNNGYTYEQAQAFQQKLWNDFRRVISETHELSEEVMRIIRSVN